MGDVDRTFQSLKHHFPESGITPIGRQAFDIIGSILDDPSPDLIEVKRRLGKCLAANPGSPERALLAHLRETSELVNAERQHWPPSQAVDDWRVPGNRYP